MRPQTWLPIVVILVTWGLTTHGKFSNSGDEPHYLAITESLITDGDLDLTNNYGDGGQRWFPGDGLTPGPHARRTASGTLAPVHDIGVPIVIVSAKGTEVDRILGLELGADDYITKPFSPREMVARVRIVLRRTAPVTFDGRDHPLVVGSIHLDLDRHELRVDGQMVSLPPKECALLEYLIRRVGWLCTRDALIAEVRGVDYFGDTRTLDVHVRRLRANT